MFHDEKARQDEKAQFSDPSDSGWRGSKFLFLERGVAMRRSSSLGWWITGERDWQRST